MKKISILLLALISFYAVTLTTAFAADNAKTQHSAAKAVDYYSSKHKKIANGAAPGPYPPATDIAIYNYSGEPIFALVPFSSINDMIYPGGVDHIYHDTMYADTHLVLQDYYHHLIFDNFVCRHANVTVYGNPSPNNITVQCY